MKEEVYQLAYNSIDILHENGILFASSRDEAYGCVFGRDTAITVLLLLHTYTLIKDQKILDICLSSLFNLLKLQGKEINKESGEEPGKIIHEYRTSNYERLINRAQPWYVYPDGILRNYDSVDSTPLTLIALHKVNELTKGQYLESFKPHVVSGLRWILDYGDKNGDGFIDYTFYDDREYGGLHVQSWTDSVASLKAIDGSFPEYPIAPCELQALTWVCLRLWSATFLDHPISPELVKRSQLIKSKFKDAYIFNDPLTSRPFIAQALDGKGEAITTITANPAFFLWPVGPEGETLAGEYVPSIVERLMMPDMFHPKGGIRTMSTTAITYNSTRHSYHNGSFWPMINGVAYLGFVSHGFKEQAKKLLDATLEAIDFFKTPIELYIIENNEYLEYISYTGKLGCRYQAWTAAALMAMLATDRAYNTTTI